MNYEKHEARLLAAAGAMRGGYNVLLKPAVAESPAVAAWGLVLGTALAYDGWAVATKNETMSGAFHRAWENPNPIYKYMCIGLVGALAVHLCHGTKAPIP